MKNVCIADHSLTAKTEFRYQDLRFSDFCHFFNNGKGQTAVYHSLAHEVVFFPENDLQMIRGALRRSNELLIPNIVESLVRTGLLVSKDYNETIILEQVRNQFLGAPSFGILYLLLTDVCNLSCSYCFIEGSLNQKAGHKFEMMNKETAEKGLRLFADSIKKNPPARDPERKNIIFYGGEPTLNQETLLFAIKFIGQLKKSDALPKDCQITLLTNGTNINSDLTRQIKEQEVVVSVSVDGFKEHHDANRVFIDRKPTYDLVIANVNRLKEEGIPISFSCTISKENIDSLKKIVRFFKKEFGVSSLGFNMLVEIPNFESISAGYAKKATTQIIECYKIARKLGVYEDRMMRKIKAFAEKRLHPVDCGGCGNQFVVAPDGKIGPCQAFLGSGKYFPVSVTDSVIDLFSDPVFKEWSKRSPFYFQMCHRCPALGICGGGCAYNSYIKYGDIFTPDSNFCIHSKSILEWMIWDLYQQVR